MVSSKDNPYKFYLSEFVVASGAVSEPGCRGANFLTLDKRNNFHKQKRALCILLFLFVYVAAKYALPKL